MVHDRSLPGCPALSDGEGPTNRNLMHFIRPPLLEGTGHPSVTASDGVSPGNRQKGEERPLETWIRG